MKNYLFAAALLAVTGVSCQHISEKSTASKKESTNNSLEKQDSILGTALLENMNTSSEGLTFNKDLLTLLENNPNSIAYGFPKLVEAGMQIATSTDQVLRIFSWDDNQGGSMRYFNTIFQIHTPETQTVHLKSTNEDRTYYPFYTNIETVQLDGHTYYLAFARSILSNSEVDYAVECYTIQNGALQPANLFQVDTKPTHILHETINVHGLDHPEEELITFDTKNVSITIPAVQEDGAITQQTNTYQYKDGYFQKVK